MYLKRIELTGFKSFPTRTVLTLEPEMTCIVGPNGSGKSNIADAVRWVLGENSARNIRGGKMEDVIFAGSGKRRSLGVAEVTIILDNSDGCLPLQFSEISVTRRAVRHDSSEYFINQQPCRLKDIRDLFVDSGVSVEGLTIIDQGRIHQLISARPEERRALVEEAAGIVKYRDRKRDALRKLDETERHLERIGDIISELDGRLGPLLQQSQTAQQYLQLKEECDRMEIGVSVRVLDETDEKLADIDAKLAELERTLLESESERLSVGAEAEQLRLDIAAQDQDVAEANEAYHRLQTDREHEEGQLTLARTQQQAALAAVERWQRELTEGEQALAARRQEEEELAAHISRTEQELAAARESVLSGESGGVDLEQRARQLTADAAACQERLSELHSRLAAAQKSSELKAEAAARLSLELEKLAAEAEQLRQDESGFTADAAALEQQQNELNAASRQHSAAAAQLDGQLRQLTVRTQELAADEADCRFRCHSQQTRVTMLAEMVGGYEGFFPGVKGLMTACRAGRGPQGVVGVMAELMRVPADYRVAVEAYLGANLQNIVTDTTEQAKAAVAFLKKNELGRATFLPLDELQVRPEADFSAVLKGKGVRGRASQLVQVEERLRPAVDFLLNNVLIVDDMDAAVAAARTLRYRCSVVTLDGDMVNPGASISGGSRGKKAGQLLGQQARLEEARAELAALQQELTGHEQAMSAHRAQVEALTTEGDQLRDALRSVSEQLADNERRREQLDIRCDALRDRAQAVQREQGRLHGELAAAEEEAAVAEGQSTQLTHEADSVKQEWERLNAAAETARQAAAGHQQDVTSVRLAVASGEEKLRGQNISLERLRTAINDLCWEAESRSADLRAAEQESSAHAQAAADAEQALTELGAALHQAGERLELARHGLAAESARLLELEKQEKALFKTADGLKADAHQLQLRRERWQADFENESVKLREGFGLELEQARARLDGQLPARTVLLGRVSQLKREIAALGAVNVAAIAEYAEVSDRYAFLTGQRDDMLSAREKLNTVIHEMDSVMTERFRQAFTQLSAALDSSFRRLFGGGSASLFLSAPDDILETGVELRVDPPGKKVANYNLLSGGEKSLVGIALLFAMLSVRPTPFCLMDEVDAALDEANIGRFTAYLQEQAASTQFLMISHRQSTMEAATALWGVTMEEEGVSKVLSVRLTEDGQTAAS